MRLTPERSVKTLPTPRSLSPRSHDPESRRHWRGLDAGVQLARERLIDANLWAARRIDTSPARKGSCGPSGVLKFTHAFFTLMLPSRFNVRNLPQHHPTRESLEAESAIEGLRFFVVFFDLQLNRADALRSAIGRDESQRVPSKPVAAMARTKVEIGEHSLEPAELRVEAECQDGVSHGARPMPYDPDPAERAAGDEPSDRGCRVLPEADAVEPVIRPDEREEVGEVGRSRDGDRGTPSWLARPRG
jgi:hypothetical protein